MDCSPPGFSAQRIFQAGILEWMPVHTLGNLPDLGIETASLPSPSLAGGFFTASAVWGAKWWQCLDLVALWHVGSSWTRNQTFVSCTGRWILNHWATREALDSLPYNSVTYVIYRSCSNDCFLLQTSFFSPPFWMLYWPLGPWGNKPLVWGLMLFCLGVV